MNVLDLQKTYPIFSYDSYSFKYNEGNLVCSFHFTVGEHAFTPTITIENVGTKPTDIEQYVFHLGLSEIATYWKAFCSPTIQIQAGFLDDTQIKFWKKLILNGMGEFFFVNKIKPFAPEVRVTANSEQRIEIGEKSPLTPNPYTLTPILVPIGGGKDSVVSLEILANAGFEVSTFSSPVGSSEEIISTFTSRHTLKNSIVFIRTIDPYLITLNTQGHPNGHTPFSSVLAFLTTLTAKVFGIPYIAVSNERSANESTGEYEGMKINHQYSKSFEFEQDFQDYSTHTFTSAPLYFSFMRPLYELQIVKLFTQYPAYFSVFHSCNVGQKTNTWCGKCAKCTFVALMLSAFIDDETIIDIFGSQILNDTNNQIFVDELLGKTDYKPFECVGTVDETWAAIYLAYARRKGKEIPHVIATYSQEIEAKESSLKLSADTLIESFSHEHSLPSEFLNIFPYVSK